ncbi:MAG: dihydrolipoamide acetyltransferase family protein [Bacteroidota bacterium]
MANYEILMPRMGESITDATITKWLKHPGEQVEEDDPVAEIATDKVDSEIPSPVAGVVKELLFNEGDVAEVGKPVMIIEISNEEETDQSAAPKDEQETIVPAAELKKQEPESFLAKSDVTTSEKSDLLTSRGPSGRFYSPLVRSIAEQEGITMAELESIKGSGKDNRLIKDDLLNYISNRSSTTQTKDLATAAAKSEKTTSIKPSLPAPQPGKGDEVIEMTRMRKLIVEHMVASEDTSVHVTSFMEIDVTNLVKWREKYKDVFLKREGEKLTYTPVFISAVAKAIKDFPMINASVSGQKIILRKDVNIGMAAALPDGNLIVPVIKKADEMSLIGLAKKVNDFANRARNNQLKPEEIQDGTFTLTNVGSFDTLFATPIINQPQVAILAVGAIKKKPVVLETEHGDTIAIRNMMYLSMSYDHRIIDGALGGKVLQRIGNYLQNWDVSQTI